MVADATFDGKMDIRPQDLPPPYTHPHAPIGALD